MDMFSKVSLPFIYTQKKNIWDKELWPYKKMSSYRCFSNISEVERSYCTSSCIPSFKINVNAINSHSPISGYILLLQVSARNKIMNSSKTSTFQIHRKLARQTQISYHETKRTVIREDNISIGGISAQKNLS